MPVTPMLPPAFYREAAGGVSSIAVRADFLRSALALLTEADPHELGHALPKGRPRAASVCDWPRSLNNSKWVAGPDCMPTPVPQ